MRHKDAKRLLFRSSWFNVEEGLSLHECKVVLNPFDLSGLAYVEFGSALGVVQFALFGLAANYSVLSQLSGAFKKNKSTHLVLLLEAERAPDPASVTFGFIRIGACRVE